jgi:hypothetical protein
MHKTSQKSSTKVTMLSPMQSPSNPPIAEKKSIEEQQCLFHKHHKLFPKINIFGKN